MRIVIEIEGVEISAKDSQVKIESKLPPSDVLEKAASVGAQDAGAAPAQNMGSQTSPMPSQTNPPSAPVADNDNVSAGAAPPLPSGQ
jgi:hypothetical protein